MQARHKSKTYKSLRSIIKNLRISKLLLLKNIHSNPNVYKKSLILKLLLLILLLLPLLLLLILMI